MEGAGKAGMRGARVCVGRTAMLDHYTLLTHTTVVRCATQPPSSRKRNMEKGRAYLRVGNRAAAHACFTKAVDVTPQMAYNLIKVHAGHDPAFFVVNRAPTNCLTRA